jgi:hypothetical protein
MEWISVKNRLPPQDGKPFIGFDPKKEDNGKIYVLIFVKGKIYPPGEFESLSYEDHYLEASGETYFKWEPTQWMPLPEKPKDN